MKGKKTRLPAEAGLLLDEAGIAALALAALGGIKPELEDDQFED